MFSQILCAMLQATLISALTLRATNNTILAIDNSTMSLVRANAISSSLKSWELGTLSEALLEMNWPELSIFTTHSYPPNKLNTTRASAYPGDVVKIAQGVLGTRASGVLPLIADDAVGDPASIGGAVLLANYTEKSNTRFEAAATDQLNYLLKKAGRSPSGAISHRADQVQLWADFVYMAPPFIADYGLWKGDNSEKQLLQEAYDQCRLYREALLTPEAGLWRHITLGSWSDKNHWATGNAWAAAGMLRVLQSVRKSSKASAMKSQQADLKKWIYEVLTASFKNQKSTGAIGNVIDDPTSFSDSAATALLSATAFRYSTLFNDKSLIPEASKALKFVKRKIDSQGWLTNTVDPYAFFTESAPGARSPEGQSFVILLNSAVEDYLSSTDKRTNPSVFANFQKD